MKDKTKKQYFLPHWIDWESKIPSYDGTVVKWVEERWRLYRKLGVNVEIGWEAVQT